MLSPSTLPGSTRGRRRYRTLLAAPLSLLKTALIMACLAGAASANDTERNCDSTNPSSISQTFDNRTWTVRDQYPVPLPASGTAAPSAEIDPDIQALLDSMSLKEKAAQMMQLEIGVFIDCNGELDEDKFTSWVKEWGGIGSLLETPGNHGGKYNWYTPHTLADIVDRIQNISLEHGTHSVPVLYGIDDVHGANYIKGPVLFPQGIGMAATFNPDLAREAGRITAKDTRSAGISWTFAPILDLGVNKYWPRIYEGLGEDPLLSSRMGVATIHGLQGNYKLDRTRIAATAKHFIAYGTASLDLGSRIVPDHMLMEYYVPAFRDAIVDGGVATVMSSYSILNGETVTTSHYYLSDLLREQLGFNGVLVTDWGEVQKTVYEHFTAENFRQAALQTMQHTSVDLSMIAEDDSFGRDLIALVDAGLLDVARIDESVGRLLQLKKDLGLFDDPFTDRSLIETVGSKQDREAAIEAGRQSLTLLKNDNGALPLRLTDNVLVVGPTADSIRFLSGGWSVHWQGPSEEEGDSVYGDQGATILDGIGQITGERHRPTFVNSTTIDGNVTQSDLEAVIAAARKADKVVVCLGEHTYAEAPGNIDHLDLPQGQIDLVNTIAKATDAKIAVVLVEGRPRSLQNIPDIADSILLAYLPGPWGGIPIAEALYGKFSPSGRLPFTYPKFGRQAPLTYWAPKQDKYDPQWEFGAGLGYSNITYSDLRLSRNVATVGDKVRVSVTVTNAGPYDQLEPVLLFTSQTIRPLYSPEHRRLRDFSKVFVAAGDSRTVEFDLNSRDLGFWAGGHYGVEYKYTSGQFTVMINNDGPTASFNLTLHYDA
ncbi:hypothetical protein EV182_001993 [Spiromyces aspiralis]|uniref:Uncharacterized protein n=1 Tax=Spiromyces aspiralis TaxID=68401 RepID=A0ACC1HIM7_9FUNG|nr:hypothetical protein EV182_001993 [Spiromyces aspiralis]